MAGWAVRQVMIAGFLPDVTDNVYQRCMRVVWQGMAGGAQGRGVEDLGCVVGARMRGGREKKHEKLKLSSLFSSCWGAEFRQIW